MADLSHTYGGDLELTSSGNLALSFGSERSQQRVIRLLYTNKSDDINHMSYGAGLPNEIGKNLSVSRIKALVTAEMRNEATVAQSPPPKVSVEGYTTGLVSVTIQYTDNIDGAQSVITDTFRR